MPIKLTALHLDNFQKVLDFFFKDKNLLKMALLHPSHTLSKKDSPFERLEFLGDRVLGIVIADFLFHMFPTEKEGDLARRLATLVSRTQCMEIGTTLEISKYVTAAPLAQGQTTVISDTLEALIGAIYLDSGLEAAKSFIGKFWQPYIQKSQSNRDNKTMLQEWAQGNGYGIPVYTIISSQGPAHAPLFEVEATIGPKTIRATGSNRRQAEQIVAKELLDYFLQRPS